MVDDGGFFWHGFHGFHGFGFLVGIKCGKDGERRTDGRGRKTEDGRRVMIDVRDENAGMGV